MSGRRWVPWALRPSRYRSGMPAGPPLLAVLLLAGAVLAEPSPVLDQVTFWANFIGDQLQKFGEKVVRRQEAQDAFKAASRVVPQRGPDLLSAIAKEIERMMRIKISAVKKIVEKAEEQWRNSPYEIRKWPLYQYRDAKRLNITKPFIKEDIELKENGHFFGALVNTTYSAVHVPTHVYDGASPILRGIEWSLGLDEAFVENYKNDPSLYWQYFGSSMGFMRRYPATWWDPKPSGEVDLFDCRTRAWYIEAASSPKDVLILVDNSGSMTGQKRELARHIVFEILDTLGSNDYVNIISFNVTVLEVVCCFKNKLVQANLANIRDLKIGMESLEKPRNITDFPTALNEAFRILNDFRFEKRGSNCNQAMMLITDGSPETFKEIFEAWNWLERPMMPVRVFTYLIGPDADLREMKWMACANRGYFGHISVVAEVRELVLRYISVMARPLVLNNTYHPVVWAPVYADIVDPKMTDYLWELKEREIQKGISWLLRKTQLYKDWKNGKFKHKKKKDMTLKEIANLAIQDDDLKDDREYLIDTTIKRYPYKMMTSVSLPVYDTRDNSSIEANILGVAGTDVPNFEIQRLMVPHMLGVNGYAFIVTNNGYILIHPELRPEFQVSINGETVSILKPNYNNVDFMDVELPFRNLADEDEDPEIFNKTYINDGERCSNEDKFRKPNRSKLEFPCRKDDPDLLALREKIINGARNGSTILNVKNHYDGLRRVFFSKKHYLYTSINEAPFELVVVLPDGYGLNRIEPKPEIASRQYPRRKKELFRDQNWKVHPNWYYCKYHFTGLFHFNSSEEELLHFLHKISQPGWKWPKPPRGSPEHYHCHICNTFRNNSDKPNFYCDKTLILSILSDVKATEWFSESVNFDSKQIFGLVLTFIATKSGLTRWQDVYAQYKSESGENHFSETHKSAIDETWYKRAVEQYYVDPQDFVYSVPFGVGEKEGTLVTASQAVFLINGTIEAPVAVVGFQFKHSAFHNLFVNVTYCSHEHKTVKSCESAAYACYILDNNGYVIVSENLNETGKFFGSVQGAVMESMVKEKIFREIEVHDYQAVCFVNVPKKENKKSYFDNRLYINRTRPQPCETKVNLYILNNKKVKNGISAQQCSRPYFVKDIRYSNLILVVINSSCTIDKNITILAQPEEVTYDNFWCCKSNRNLPRKNVAECANFNEMEQEIENVCGNAPAWLASFFFIVIMTMITGVVTR